MSKRLNILLLGLVLALSACGGNTNENNTPVAKFTNTLNGGDFPLVVTVTSTSTDADGTIQDISWDWGDGSTSKGTTATHTYMSAGDFTLKLSVTDNNKASATSEKMVQVTTPIPNDVQGQLPGYTLGEGVIEASFLGNSYGTGYIDANGNFTLKLADTVADEDLLGFGDEVASVVVKKSLSTTNNGLSTAALDPGAICPNVSISDSNVKAFAIPYFELRDSVSKKLIAYITQLSDKNEVKKLIDNGFENYADVNAKVTVRIYVNGNASIQGSCDVDSFTGSFDVDFKTGWNFLNVAVDGEGNVVVTSDVEDSQPWTFATPVELGLE
jgi:PKD repeat protein